MKKKQARIVIFVVGCLLAVWGMVIYPMLHRGTIAVSVTNQTSDTYTLVRINDQAVGKSVEPGSMVEVDYLITEEGTITAYLETEDGEPLERLLTEGVTPTVTKENYGRVLLTLKEKNGTLELSLMSNISK